MHLNNHEVGNGAFCFLLTLLKALIPIWKAEENSVIISGNTLYIKLGGKEVLKPDHQYCICLYVGREKYEDLAKVRQLYISKSII
ncbi:hypothetical protein C1646_776118 [Rhizophagus diaphanus]|nr:hypothetical protein C1646_776118 [Rhizophagus diaphanus] [Rhizophagus sp. MUCL 43196]